jgi:Glycosyl hydrolases family 16
VLATVALAGAALPVEATAMPAAAQQVATAHVTSAHAASAHAAMARRTVVMRKRVLLTGVYYVQVSVIARSARRNTVNLRIGHKSRRATTGRRHRHTSVGVKVTVRGRMLRIRAIAQRGKPRLHVKMWRIRALVAKKPGKTRSSGTQTAPAPVVPVAATPAAPAAPAAPVAPAGLAPIVLPSGFAPITNFTNPVKDYQFNTPSLPTDWSTGTSNYGYQATQYQPSQVSFTGSSVALTAIKQTSPSGDPYTSGWITTAGKYSVQYGRITFRAQMPAGQGLWSGLWLVNAAGSNPQGEIDVQEMLLGNTHTVNGSLHGWAPGPTWGETQSTVMTADASQGFHDYSVVWQPGMLTWAVDGVAYAQYTQAQATAAGHPWPFATPEYLIANLAVASASEWGGAPTAATAFPSAMQVQSVKVWQ